MEERQDFVIRRLVPIAATHSRVLPDIFQPCPHLRQDTCGDRVPLLDDAANHDRALPAHETVEYPYAMLPATEFEKPLAECAGVRQP